MQITNTARTNISMTSSNPILSAQEQGGISYKKLKNFMTVAKSHFRAHSHYAS
ncbi:hypothetical protein THICB3560288 [Thiomonas sp. CB3]|nr:hypothetical protein THICB3560288 [Thiomonas sp. CB3]